MRTIYLSLSILLLAGFPGCDNQKPSQPMELIKGGEEKEYEKVSVTFDHPCAYVNAEDIERVRAHVVTADAADPVYAAWLSFCSSEWAQETVKPDALSTIVRGDPAGTGVDKENYIVCDRQAAAVWARPSGGGRQGAAVRRRPSERGRQSAAMAHIPQTGTAPLRRP